jgi:hypothetical protein
MPSLLRLRATPKPEKVNKKLVVTLSNRTSDKDKEIAAMKKWVIKKKLDPEKLSNAKEARFDAYYKAFKVAVVAAVAAAA